MFCLGEGGWGRVTEPARVGMLCSLPLRKMYPCVFVNLEGQVYDAIESFKTSSTAATTRRFL